MTSNSESCLVRHLSNFAELDKDSMEAIAKFEKENVDYAKNEIVVPAGEVNDYIYVVKRGWLYQYRDTIKGGRQIIRLFVPGDIIGICDLTTQSSPSTLYTCAEITLCPFPKTGLQTVFRRSPQLAAVLLGISARDQVLLSNKIAVMGRLDVTRRVAYFLLTLHARLSLTNPEMNNSFRLPLTQHELGDAVGSTNVSMSRSLARLKEKGFLTKNSGRIFIRDLDGMKHYADFRNHYADMDLSWIPDGR